jgi:hypothetical protein
MSYYSVPERLMTLLTNDTRDTLLPENAENTKNAGE